MSEFQKRVVLLRGLLGYPTDPASLRAKLTEEVREVLTAPTLENLVEEVGDVLVVLAALLHSNGLSLDEAERVVTSKLRTRAKYCSDKH